MSNMKQKSVKSETQTKSATPGQKKTVASTSEKSKTRTKTAPPGKKKSVTSTKTSGKASRKTEIKQNVEIPVANGIENKNLKRKTNVEGIATEKKKTKSEEDDDTNPVEVLLDGEVEVMEVQEVPQRTVKVKKVAKDKRIAASRVASSNVGSKTAVKRKKALLEVPRLPEISGVLFVIGENDIGQLGLGEGVEQRKRPFELDFPGRFVDIAAGGMHSVTLTSTGEVFTFGCNDEGALGRYTEDDEELSHVPGKVEIPDVVVKICAGDSHSAALTENGRVYIWGSFRGGDGVMGLMASVTKSIKPVRILHSKTIVSIASGVEHFVCLTDDGIVYTFGCGENGQLGRISERSSKGKGRKGLVDLLEPQAVTLRQNGRRIIVSDIWTGSYSTFVKCKTTGAIYAFGLNNFHQLGLPLEPREDEDHRAQAKYNPERVESFLPEYGWQRISGGQHHTLALSNQGQVFALGRKEYGRLGLGNEHGHADVPTLIPTLAEENCIDISSGNVVSFSVTDSGLVYSWGFGTSYQLGHGDDADRYVPKCIEGNFVSSWHAFRVSGGGQHTLILAKRKGTTEETSERKQ